MPNNRNQNNNRGGGGGGGQGNGGGGGGNGNAGQNNANNNNRNNNGAGNGGQGNGNRGNNGGNANGSHRRVTGLGGSVALPAANGGGNPGSVAGGPEEGIEDFGEETPVFDDSGDYGGGSEEDFSDPDSGAADGGALNPDTGAPVSTPANVADDNVPDAPAGAGITPPDAPEASYENLDDAGLEDDYGSSDYDEGGFDDLSTEGSAVGPSYIVNPGDTLSGIAQQHGIALADLEALNPQITNPNMIFPGQSVTVGAPVAMDGMGGMDGEFIDYETGELLDSETGGIADPELESESDGFPTSSTYPPPDEDAPKRAVGRMRSFSKRLKGWGSGGNIATDPARRAMYISSERNTNPLEIKDDSNTGQGQDF